MDSISVFISYSRREADIAEELVTTLEARGLEVLLDRRDLPYGEEWEAELAEMIFRADAVVWLASPTSVQSRWCRWELGEVSRLHKRLVPVRVAPVALEEMPTALGRVQILPSEGVFELEAHADLLVEALLKDQKWLKQHTRLADRAREWESRDKSADALLRGGPLRAAEEWARHPPPASAGPSGEVLALLLASRQGADQRKRRLLAVFIATTVGALALGAFALMQRNEARRQELAATARSLVSAAALEQQSGAANDERAALLVRQAYLFHLRSERGSESALLGAVRRVVDAPRFTVVLAPSQRVESVSDDFRLALVREGETYQLAKVDLELGMPLRIEIDPVKIKGSKACRFLPGRAVVACLDAAGVWLTPLDMAAPQHVALPSTPVSLWTSQR